MLWSPVTNVRTCINDLTSTNMRSYQERKADNGAIEQSMQQLQRPRPSVQVWLFPTSVVECMKASDGEVESRSPPSEEREVAECSTDHLFASDHEVGVDVDITQRLLCQITSLPCVCDNNCREDIDGDDSSNACQDIWRDDVGSYKCSFQVEAGGRDAECAIGQ